MVSQAELISKGYHSLVHGLISIFLETVWVPLMLLKLTTTLCQGQGQISALLKKFRFAAAPCLSGPCIGLEVLGFKPIPGYLKLPLDGG